MKKLFLLFQATLCFSSLFAQQNIELAAQLDYVSRNSATWGYVAPDGSEYALVGLASGVSIVNLENPEQPVQVALVPMQQSSWRELKTFGEFAYVVTDAGGTTEGVKVIDLSGLPGGVQSWNWKPVLPGQTDTLFRCHTIYIDSQGIAYLNGCDKNSGGVIFTDVFSDPGNPKFLGYGDPVYAHDSYARNDTLYTAEIYQGRFSVFDISNLANPVKLAHQETPFKFTHNVWLSDDSKIIFTTDERADASVAAYDISDLTNIRLLDEFRMPNTLGKGVIPHNVHVLNDFLVIAYYTEGVTIVDASRPENLVQVGNYDTNHEFENGFHGVWDAFPYYPSVLISAGDIENGLFVLKPTYVRAAWLEGEVTDKETGNPVVNASVEILSADPNFAASDATGNYKTGQPTPGNFEVKFRAKGYFDLILSDVPLLTGKVNLLNVDMTPLPVHATSGKVVEKLTGTPVPGAIVHIENHDFSYTDTTDAGGNFTLPPIKEGSYVIFVGKWGYENLTLENQPFDSEQTLLFEVEKTYEDNFNLDLGWQVSGDAHAGQWERGIPKPLNVSQMPTFDSPADEGDFAYVTGNKGFSLSDDDVDKGYTLLTSPPMQLRSRYNRPLLSYDAWFFNPDAATPADDSLTVFVSNGKRTVILEAITEDTFAWRASPRFDLASFIEITNDMRIAFRVADTESNGHILEAGIDNFKVEEGLADEAFGQVDELVKMRFYPNPFRSELNIDYKVEKSYRELKLLVFNVLGQKIQEVSLENPLGTVRLELDVAPGIYFLAFRLDDKLSGAASLVKSW